MSKIEEAKIIIQTLHEHGYEAYIIGGYVRDLLLNKQNDDIDITTNANPEEVTKIFPKTFLTGIKHGTVTVLINKNQYEITTFREESNYINNRKPKQVTFVSSLKDDVTRRDFTMNAVALTVDDQIIDYVNGQEDIENKVIKTVGDPFLRFSEDALRMLRAFRFVSILGFTIEENVLKAIGQNASLIRNISNERIIKEFELMVKGNHLEQAINYMIESNFYCYLPTFEKAIKKMKDTKFKPNDFFEFLAFCSACSSFEQINKLPLPNYLKREIKICDEMYSVNITDFSKLVLFRNGLNNCLVVNKLNVYLNHTKDLKDKIIDDFNTMPIHKQCDLTFKGDDIIELYDKAPGGWISDILDELCLKILLDELENDYQKIRQYLLSKV